MPPLQSYPLPAVQPLLHRVNHLIISPLISGRYHSPPGCLHPDNRTEKVIVIVVETSNRQLVENMKYISEIVDTMTLCIHDSDDISQRMVSKYDESGKPKV